MVFTLNTAIIYTRKAQTVGDSIYWRIWYCFVLWCITMSINIWYGLKMDLKQHMQNQVFCSAIKNCFSKFYCLNFCVIFCLFNTSEMLLFEILIKFSINSIVFLSFYQCLSIYFLYNCKQLKASLEHSLGNKAWQQTQSFEAYQKHEW